MNKLSSGGASYSVNGSVTQVPVMANGILKWHFCPHWIAYGGAGAGYDFNSFDLNSAGGINFNTKSSENDFAWQVMGGVKYKLGHNEIGVGYTYFTYTPSGFKSVGNNTIFASYTFDF
jgi:opacity protein-like surface antigen